MTAALVAALVIGLTCAVIATHRPVDRATFDAPSGTLRVITEQGDDLGRSIATARTIIIAAYIEAGGHPDDIIGELVTQHPSGAVHVQLVTTDDAEGIADEAADWMGGGAA